MESQNQSIDTNYLLSEEEKPKRSLSYIESHEEIEAKEYIEKQLGFPVPHVCGYHLLLKIYTRPEDFIERKNDDGSPVLDHNGKPIIFYLPESVTAHDKYRNCTALVVGVGPIAYGDERFTKSGPLCKPGDWVVIPRNEGTQINYRNVPMMIMPDDRVLMVVEDPTYVTRD